MFSPPTLLAVYPFASSPLRLLSSPNTAYDARLLDKPVIAQMPLRCRIRQLNSEVPQDLWDEL